MMRSALDAIGNREIDLKVRISNMEQEMKDLRHQNEDLKSKLENTEEPNDVIFSIFSNYKITRENIINKLGGHKIIV